MTWNEWWESELRRIFDEHYASFGTEQRTAAKQKFESEHRIAAGRDSYGIRSHNTYRNNTYRNNVREGGAKQGA